MAASSSAACGWAFTRPVRKVSYNLVITGLSIAGRDSDLSGTDVRTLVSDRLAFRAGVLKAYPSVTRSGSAQPGLKILEPVAQ